MIRGVVKSMNTQNIVCLNCRQSLKQENDMLICSCGEEYSIKDNIPILLPKDKYLERLNILNKELENLTTTYDKIHSQELYNVLEEHKFLPTFVYTPGIK